METIAGDENVQQLHRRFRLDNWRDVEANWQQKVNDEL
jgi:hypothetical protein